MYQLIALPENVLGWTGDAQLFLIRKLYDGSKKLFHKWLQDGRFTERNGLIYNINPSNPNNPQIWSGCGRGAGWGMLL